MDLKIGMHKYTNPKRKYSPNLDIDLIMSTLFFFSNHALNSELSSDILKWNDVRNDIRNDMWNDILK